VSRIRTLIVDDEPAARDAISTLLAGDPGIEVVGECADGVSALAAIRTELPDLLFLDVQMPEMDGFSVLRELAPDELPVVIFSTAYDQYALRAFEVHALDYLLKPFDDTRFHEAVERAKEAVRRGRLGALSVQLLDLLDGGRPGTAAAAGGPGGSGGTGRSSGGARYLQRLVIKTDGRVAVVNVKDIDWIEADGDYARIHAAKQWHVLRETMRSLEEQLDPARFARIHRSTIVNVERIKELQPYFRGDYVVILHDGTSLKLSRGYRPRLEEALGKPF
jgi:two-component system LytT family response regulator